MWNRSIRCSVQVVYLDRKDNSCRVMTYDDTSFRIYLLAGVGTREGLISLQWRQISVSNSVRFRARVPIRPHNPIGRGHGLKHQSVWVRIPVWAPNVPGRKPGGGGCSKFGHPLTCWASLKKPVFLLSRSQTRHFVRDENHAKSVSGAEIRSVTDSAQVVSGIPLESDATGDVAMTLKVMRAPKAPGVRFYPLSALGCSARIEQR